jgi:ligand-binding sensor domain-containing protein
MRSAFLLLVLLLNTWLCFSANEQFLFKRISISEGLSNSWVRCTYQDKSGYMWFGTNDGLNRFDGRNIKVFRPMTDNQVPLGNLAIRAIVEADSQSFWLCTEVGLFRFLRQSETVVRDMLLPNHPILSVAKDPDGSVWFGTNRGLVKYSPDKKTKEVFVNDPLNKSSVSDNYINALTISSNGELWIGTKNGLNRFDRSANKFIQYFHIQSKGSISGNNISSIFEDSRKRIWIGTSLDGLNLYAPNSKGGVFSKIMSGSITTILQVKEDKLWVGMASGGGDYHHRLKRF